MGACEQDIVWTLATTAPSSTTAMLVQFLPIVLIFVVFYFLLIRPNQKRQRLRLQMLANLKKGDKIITVGGIFGTIVELTDDAVVLLVNDVTKLTCTRSSVDGLAEPSAQSA